MRRFKLLMPRTEYDRFNDQDDFEVFWLAYCISEAQIDNVSNGRILSTVPVIGDDDIEGQVRIYLADMGDEFVRFATATDIMTVYGSYHDGHPFTDQEMYYLSRMFPESQRTPNVMPTTL